MKKTIYVLAGILIFLVACKKVTNSESYLTSETPLLGETAADYSIRGKEKHLPFQLSQNSTFSNEKIELGRVLFYDKKLSVNQAISCASCHKQELAFSDGVKASRGFGNEETPRNSMAIVNSDFGRGLFWDLREFNVRSMVTKPVQNHIEMGFDSITQTLDRLQNTSYYPALFERAFGTKTITVENLSEALGGFVSNLISFKSPYDFAADNNFASYTSEEIRGWEIFNEKRCIGCHGFDLTQGWSTEVANIGLDLVYKDKGAQNVFHGGIFEPPFDPRMKSGEGFFKVPTLRNIALTAPYMHDGRFATLEEVVEHYNSGIKDHPNLDWALRDEISSDFSKVKAKKMNLSAYDKKALIAFLKTLTDQSFIHDKKFSNPFVAKVN
ncbi:MAG: cytochrome-c peroxidase [Bacteroidia bacterium]